MVMYTYMAFGRQKQDSIKRPCQKEERGGKEEREVFLKQIDTLNLGGKHNTVYQGKAS